MIYSLILPYWHVKCSIWVPVVISLNIQPLTNYKHSVIYESYFTLGISLAQDTSLCTTPLVPGDSWGVVLREVSWPSGTYDMLPQNPHI